MKFTQANRSEVRKFMVEQVTKYYENHQRRMLKVDLCEEIFLELHMDADNKHDIAMMVSAVDSFYDHFDFNSIIAKSTLFELPEPEVRTKRKISRQPKKSKRETFLIDILIDKEEQGEELITQGSLDLSSNEPTLLNILLNQD